MTDSYLMGIDLGSSSVEVAIADLEEKLLSLLNLLYYDFVQQAPEIA